MWQVIISTTAEAEEAAAGLLERFLSSLATVYCDEATGARRVTVYPARLPDSPERLRSRLREAVRELRAGGLDFGRSVITIKPLPRENWAESWKRHFKPIEIGQALLIKPGWSRRRPRPGQQVVILDPGLSFGTGHHPTTLFCLRQLARCRRRGWRQSFFDIGTGSGILAIAAARLGYGPVEAIDCDPAAVRVSRENAARNRVQDVVRPQKKDLSRLKTARVKEFDIICANLTSDILMSEAGKIRARLKPGGKLIIAGILQEEFGNVAKILQRFGLTFEFSVAYKPWKSGQFVL